MIQPATPQDRLTTSKTRFLPVISVLERLASLKVTLALLAVLGVGVVFAYQSEAFRSWLLAPPLFLLAANLVAAMLTNAVFRRQAPLMAFHVCLVALLILAGVGRLTELRGELELTEGQSFDGTLANRTAGPYHPDGLAAIRFSNDGFTIEYNPGLKRGQTRNRVTWVDADGRMRTQEIGDQNPLIIDDYRFYTSFNKGFAPVFEWYPAAGDAILGSVHLPSYPIHEYSQAREWVVPGTTRRLWIQLQFEETILDPDRPSSFRLPRDFLVVLRTDDQRHELRPGDSIDFPEGTLKFDSLRTWMGYNVFYDRTLPWLAAASALAVLSLGWHFWRKFARKPWDA